LGGTGNRRYCLNYIHFKTNNAMKKDIPETILLKDLSIGRGRGKGLRLWPITKNKCETSTIKLEAPGKAASIKFNTRSSEE